MCKTLRGIFRHPAFMMHNKPQVCAASKPRAAFYPPALRGCCQKWWHAINATTRVWQMLHETRTQKYATSVSQQSLTEMAIMFQVTSNELK